MVEFCPFCNTRYNRVHNSGDFIHQCNSGDPSIDTEDVVVIGAWVDYIGSGTVPTSHTAKAGTQNDLFGTDVGIRGSDFDGVTAKGNRKTTHRSRQRFVEIKSNIIKK